MRIPAARLAVGALLGLAAAAPSPAVAQEISFAPLPDFYPRDEDSFGAPDDHLATGDLNGDGRSDVVVADLGSPQVQVWLARPDGTLDSPATIRSTAPAA